MSAGSQGARLTSGAGLSTASGSAEARVRDHAPGAPRCLPLAALPTPVERAPWLDAFGRSVWVKRDDQSSDIYGGGKVRKLEWILATPPHDDGRDIVSVGGTGSHHLVALALYLRQQGRGLHALTFAQTPTRHVMVNLAAMASVGVKFWNVASRPQLPLAWLAYHLWHRPERMARWMTPGASTAPGMLGFVAAGLELAEQIERGELPRPQTLYVAVGTAGTAAGLAVGLALAGVRVHMRLVSSVEPVAFNAVMFELKLRELGRALRRWGLLRPGDPRRWMRESGVTWSIDHDHVGGGYGVPTEPGLASVGHGRAQGLALETTYTGKCLAALRRDVGGEGLFRPARGPVLFWNTHGPNDLRPLVRDGWVERLPVDLQRYARRHAPPDLIGSSA